MNIYFKKLIYSSVLIFLTISLLGYNAISNNILAKEVNDIKQSNNQKFSAALTIQNNNQNKKLLINSTKDKNIANHSSKNTHISAKSEKNSIKLTIDNKEFDLSTLLNLKNVQDLDNFQLSLLRNAYYAKHGYKFEIKKYLDFFSKYDWYNPQYDNVENMLNDIDIDNINLILKIEGDFESLYSKLSEQEALLPGLWFSDDPIYESSRYYFFDDRTYAYFPKYKYDSILKEGEERLECILGNWYILGDKIYFIGKEQNILHGINDNKLTDKTKLNQHKILGGIPTKIEISSLKVENISLYSKNSNELYNNIIMGENNYYSTNNSIDKLNDVDYGGWLHKSIYHPLDYAFIDMYYIDDNHIKKTLHSIRLLYDKIYHSNSPYDIEIYDTLINFTNKNDRIFKNLTQNTIEQFLGTPIKIDTTYDSNGEVKIKYYDGIIFYDSLEPTFDILITSDNFCLSCGLKVGDTIDDISSKLNIDKSKIYIKPIEKYDLFLVDNAVNDCDSIIYLDTYDIYLSIPSIHIYLKNNKIQKILLSLG